MKKFVWKPVGEFVGQLCKCASYVLMLAASNKVADYVIGEPGSSYAGYDDAIGAIMNSDMYSHDKAAAAGALKCDGTSDFYKAIIHIANSSDSYSHDKVSMVKELSQK